MIAKKVFVAAVTENRFGITIETFQHRDGRECGDGEDMKIDLGFANKNDFQVGDEVSIIIIPQSEFSVSDKYKNFNRPDGCKSTSPDDGRRR